MSDPIAVMWYTRMGVSAVNASWEEPGSLQYGQVVYGDTALEDTRAELLSSNDDVLDGRASLVFKRYCCRRAEWDAGTWRYVFQRQGNFLLYRVSGTDTAIVWGPDNDESEQDLEAYDDDAGITYRVLDLRDLGGLPMGANYRIGGGEMGAIEFVMEVIEL